MSEMEAWAGHVIMYPCTTDISIGPGTICIMGDIYVGTQVGLRVRTPKTSIYAYIVATIKWTQSE